MSVDPKAILQRIESKYGPLAEGVPSVALDGRADVEALPVDPWLVHVRDGRHTLGQGAVFGLDPLKDRLRIHGHRVPYRQEMRGSIASKRRMHAAGPLPHRPADHRPRPAGD